MKKFIRVLTFLMALCLLWMSALPVSAETTTVAETTTAEEKTTVEEKTTAEEKTTERETTPAEEKTTEEKTTAEKTTTDKSDDEIFVAFEKGEAYKQYVYTGKVIKPKLIVKKEDGSIASPDEYTIKYMSDSKSPGAYHVTVTYLKSGYKVTLRYDIIPGTTDKINVKVKNGQVTVSWNPVPGAGVYRVYKYNEETGRYSEMWWSDGQIASPKTSRTFTSKELKPGGKYKMAIMALDTINQMPTDQMAYFTVDTTKDTDTAQKPVTTTKPAEKPTLITPQPTKPGETEESVATTTPEDGTTFVPESTTGIMNVFDELKNNASDNDTQTEEEKEPFSKIKLVIILVIVPLAIAGIIFSLWKKKK